MENKNNRNRIILRNYNKVYTLEQKIYSLGNYRLNNPVEMIPALTFVCLAAGLYLVNKNVVSIPIPGAIQYLILPYFVANRITKTRKDGKKLFKYYVDYIEYLFTKNVERERFEKIEKTKKIQFFK